MAGRMGCPFLIRTDSVSLIHSQPFRRTRLLLDPSSCSQLLKLRFCFSYAPAFRSTRLTLRPLPPKVSPFQFAVVVKFNVFEMVPVLFVKGIVIAIVSDVAAP